MNREVSAIHKADRSEGEVTEKGSKLSKSNHGCEKTKVSADSVISIMTTRATEAMKILLASIERGGESAARDLRQPKRNMQDILKEYARYVLLVHEYVTDTEQLKDHNTYELQKCLLGLERKKAWE
jgi:tagatose-1,6-bisphosphate aldolase